MAYLAILKNSGAIYLKLTSLVWKNLFHWRDKTTELSEEALDLSILIWHNLFKQGYVEHLPLCYLKQKEIWQSYDPQRIYREDFLDHTLTLNFLL